MKRLLPEKYINFSKKLLLIFSLFFAILFCINLFSSSLLPLDDKRENMDELYDPKLARFTSINTFASYIDSVAVIQQIQIPSKEHIALVANLVAQRFYHKDKAAYSFKDNPFLWAAGYIRKGFDNVTIPDKLMKYPYGICSQQTNVFLQILNKNNYTFRPVYFSGHVASEVKVNDHWWFIDIDFEKGFKTNDSIQSFVGLKEQNKLHSLYKNSFSNTTVEKVFSSYFYGKNNSYPDRKSTLLQYAAFGLYYFIVAVSFLYLFSFFISKLRKKA